MKIIVLYGPGEVGKRSEVLAIKKQFLSENIVNVDFKGVGLKGLEMQLSSPSLFETGQRLLVVENPNDSLDLTNLAGEEALTLLLSAANPKSDSILLQSAKERGAKTLLFEGEKELTAFPFLDALIEKRKTAFLELEKLFREYGGIYVLSMVYYLLRRNLLPSPASEYMRKKVESQKNRYQQEDWIYLYQLSLETEFKIKSGIVTEETGLFLLTQKFLH